MMTETDYRTMDKTLQLVLDQFDDGNTEINTLEIGVNSGNTSRGIRDFINRNSPNRVSHNHIGVDSQKDFKMESPFEECNFLIGDSLEVSNRTDGNNDMIIENASQHFILIDGNHDLFYTIADFLAYKDKVVIGGFIAFHDTSPNISPTQDWQGRGNKDDPDFCIACRRAVKAIGLLDTCYPGWKLVFDEYEPTGIIGGIIVVQRFA